MKAIGFHDVKKEQVRAMIRNIDKDESGTVDFDEVSPPAPLASAARPGLAPGLPCQRLSAAR